MSMSKLDVLKEKVKDAVDARIVIRRYIYYIFDISTKNAMLYQDSDLTPNWRNPNTDELFTLKDVAYYFDGIPVYIVLQGFNFSVGFNIEGEPYIDKDGKEYWLYDLVRKGYTPADMDNVLNSQTVERLFKRSNKFEFRWILMVIMSWVIVILLTVMTCTTVFGKWTL